MLEAVAALGVSWMGWEAAPWPEPAQCGPARAGCSSPTEGSGVSGCLQRRDTIADAAEPREKRRRLGWLTVSSAW